MTNQKNYYKKESSKPKKNGNNNKSRVTKSYGGTGYSKRLKYNSLEKIVKTRREETVEDIRSDIERLEKDIEFEIKQIKSTKLGL